MQKLKTYIPLDFIIDIKNFRESFMKWMKIREKVNPADKPNKQDLFNKYLPVIKPVIHHFHQVTQKLHPDQYGFYTTLLNEQQLFTLKKVFSSLLQFQILVKEPTSLISKESMGELIQKKYDDIYRMDLNCQPKNYQMKWWRTTLPVQEISFTTNVIKGKGQGKKTLGMPTANLHLTEQLELSLISHPNGVYYVSFKFQNGQTFYGAGCLGTNPHYQNLQEKRVVQVYVLHEFKGEFYGASVQITFKRLIRFEGKFLTFDKFLNAMRNDIKVVQTIKSQSLADL